MDLDSPTELANLVNALLGCRGREDGLGDFRNICLGVTNVRADSGVEESQMLRESRAPVSNVVVEPRLRPLVGLEGEAAGGFWLGSTETEVIRQDFAIHE